MKIKLFRISVLTICFLLIGNVVFAQKTKSKTVVSPTVDLGKLRGNTYTNDFFELKIEFPTGWLVGDNTLEAQLQELINPQVKAKNAKNQKMINKAINRVTPLLGGYKSLPGSNPENSNLRISVENLKTEPQIKTNSDYMTALENSFKIAQMPAGFSYSKPQTEMIGKTSLSFIDVNAGNAKRRLYVLLRKRFAMLITIDSYNQTDFEDLHQILQSSDLAYKK